MARKGEVREPGRGVNRCNCTWVQTPSVLLLQRFSPRLELNHPCSPCGNSKDQGPQRPSPIPKDSLSTARQHLSREQEPLRLEYVCPTCSPWNVQQGQSLIVLSYLIRCSCIDANVCFQVKVSFSIVGHTKNDVDQMFSCFSKPLLKNSVWSELELKHWCRQGYKTTKHVTGSFLPTFHRIREVVCSCFALLAFVFIYFLFFLVLFFFI